jgi:hydrogenase-1 operon protein HyaF
MKPFPVAVRAIGPGSQPPEDEPLNVLPMPSSMATYTMPQVPEQADPHVLARARTVLAEFAGRMALQGCGDGFPTLSLLRLEPPVINTMNELLGSGEVSIKLRTDGEIRIQETVFAGVWRVLHCATNGFLAADDLIAAPIPPIVVDVARQGAIFGLPRVELPAGAMNSPALITEIRENVRRRTARDDLHARPAAHVINLSLLPLTPDDHQVLNLALPVGPVAVMSKSFGNCRVTSTGTRDVWRVQYFNSMQTMILNTIEIVDMPEVAIASEDDLADSRARLADLIEWLDESNAADGTAQLS